MRVNRLLLNNLEVVGAGWGAFVMGKRDVNREIGEAVNRLVDEGFVRPIVGARFPLEQAREALELIDEPRRHRQGRARPALTLARGYPVSGVRVAGHVMCP